MTKLFDALGSTAKFPPDALLAHITVIVGGEGPGRLWQLQAYLSIKCGLKTFFINNCNPSPTLDGAVSEL